MEANERKKEEAMHIEDIKTLVTEEIEMLKVAVYLVSRKGSEMAKAYRHINSGFEDYYNYYF